MKFLELIRCIVVALHAFREGGHWFSTLTSSFLAMTYLLDPVCIDSIYLERWGFKMFFPGQKGVYSYLRGHLTRPTQIEHRLEINWGDNRS